MNCNTATTPRRRSHTTSPQWVRLMNELSQLDKQPKHKTLTQKEFNPKANIIETSDNFTIHLAIPGYTREEVAIKIDKNKLIISSSTEQNNDAKYKLKEFSKTAFSKSFKLGDSINVQDINAKLDAGILTITLAKKEEQKPRVISVS